MLGKTHKIGGICAGMLTTSFLWQTTNFSDHALWAAPLLIGASALGSLLPDIDHPNSKIGHRVKPLSLLINKTMGHRGGTHTLIALLVVAFTLFMVNVSLPIQFQPLGWAVVLGMTVGYLSHLFLDALTPMGIPFFAPFFRKPVRFARLTTGKYDGFVTVVMVLVTAFVLYASFPALIV